MKKSEVFSAIAHEMKALGFKRRRSNYEYLLDLGNGYEGWCSFADAVKGEKSALWAATFVGVRCAEIEERILKWCGEVVPGWDRRSYVATVSMNTGYLTPRVRWLEHRIDLTEESAGRVVAPIIADVTDVVIPFVQQHTSHSAMISVLQHGQGQLADRILERLPIAMYLQGDIEGAYRELAKMKQRVDDGAYLAPRYLRFIDEFESEFPAK
ncbi:hypothetical protein [Streptomyces longwoodensis]|uniref:hypothetical protein n=1 Tax=Streptomyces longwoodensis TaxID=68231 RepID=UPI00382E3EC8